jgi:hypothetical protein
LWHTSSSRRPCHTPALGSLATGTLWFSDEATVVDLVQHSVARWAYDVAQTFRELSEALDRATASPDPEEASDPVGELETALIKVVAARDALRALAAQVFGSDRLRLDKAGKLSARGGEMHAKRGRERVLKNFSYEARRDAQTIQDVLTRRTSRSSMAEGKHQF